MDLVVNPPRPDEPSYESWLAQKDGTLASLARRAKLVAETLNSIEGFTCNVVQGAMYAFPQIHLPKKVKRSTFDTTAEYSLIRNDTKRIKTHEKKLRNFAIHRNSQIVKAIASL